MKELSREASKLRFKVVREQMASEGLDGLLVTDINDIRYLCGHHHEGTRLLVTRRSQHLLTVYRGMQRALDRSVNVNVADPRQKSGDLQVLARRYKLAVIGVHPAVTHSAFLAWSKQLKPARLKISTAVSDARSIKYPREIRLLTKAQQEAETVFDRFLSEIKPGLTEYFLYNRLLQIILDNRSLEGPSFDPIISSKLSSWTFHSRYTQRKLTKNDCIIIDMGVKYRGYCSDMTRTVFLGKPTRRMKEAYGVVREALDRSIAVTKAGTTGRFVAATCTRYMANQGHPLGNGLGHGIGLDVHDFPVPGLGPASSEPLQENMVFTIEPGCYYQDEFGIRIEDTVVVTRAGCRNITHTSKDLLIL